MAKYKLVVLTNAVAGKDDEFNEWYDNQHVPDVCAVPGFINAERFELHGDGSHKYLAIYNVETDDIDAAMEDMQSRAGTDKMILTDSLDMSNMSATVYKARD